jgi:myo-inositol-1(or 4)-monophosphatase
MNIETIIKKAGTLLISEYRGVTDSSSKERFNLVTTSDKKIESFIINEISKLHPKDNIFSEETGEIDKSSNRRWIIDPIDGTADFIFGVPYFALSVALETKNGIEEGYVYNPIANELYYSSIAEGKSFLNNSIIQVSNTEIISECFISFGFSANPKNIEKYTRE